MKLTEEQRAELRELVTGFGMLCSNSSAWNSGMDRDEVQREAQELLDDELAPLIGSWLSPAETPIRSGQTWTNHLDKSVRIAGQVDTAAGAQPLGALWVADAVDALFGQRWLVTDAWLAECGYELAEESA